MNNEIQESYYTEQETESGGIQQEPQEKTENTGFDHEVYRIPGGKFEFTDDKIALAAGIGSILMLFIFSPLGIVLGVVGILFGRKGRVNPEQKKIATAGLICAAIGLALSAISIVMTLVVLGSIFGLNHGWFF